MSTAEPWFVVLPDCDAGAAMAQELLPVASHVVRHASNRPWVVGCLEPDAAVAQAGATRLVLTGHHATTTESLTRRAEQLSDATAVDAFGRGQHGSFHLLASVDGQVRAVGSVSGVRRLFHARRDGVTVAADRQDVLAYLVRASVDEQRLALRLVYVRLPPALADASMWRRVREVPADSALNIDQDGRGRVVRRWRPPSPELPLARGAELLRAELTAAVDVRTRAGGLVSCDLSGGLDSSTVCFLAARGPAQVLSVTLHGMDPANDDIEWVRRLGPHLPGVEQLVLDPRQRPQRFAGVARAGALMEEPLEVARDEARLTALGALLAERGSRLHLGGHAGDQIGSLAPPYVHDLARTMPRVALRHLRGYAGLYRWSMPASLLALADRRPYRSWLATSASDLAGPPPSIHTPFLGWGGPLRLPPWATAAAADTVRRVLLEAVDGAEPLAPEHGQHSALEVLLDTAQTVRALQQALLRGGVAMGAPYLDDRVVEASLAVRMQDRAAPWRFKPLLAEAIRGVVPDLLLTRTTKGECSTEVAAGLRANRAELFELLSDSVLGRLGLIDAEAARGAALGRYPNLSASALSLTVACEAWARERVGQPAPNPFRNAPAAPTMERTPR
jgi:asparagine synthase (glutamine-hydrolysing)